MKPITGWHIFGLFVLGFGTIIAVNLTLAFNAVRTFPGLEVKNSYVASQSFEADRAAQNALNWTVSAHVFDGELVLSFDQDGIKVEPSIENKVKQNKIDKIFEIIHIKLFVGLREINKPVDIIQK